ncbi:MAG: DUF1674 domain-containing protein [Hyphomicrobiaceae bacterium]|nr:DUF1674 domain-containing protein [Hyphomicrobiaceae bacterium]MCC0007211.1 DUF1674 domain-containing protein [Hyphomicrobiaceae bacterium]
MSNDGETKHAGAATGPQPAAHASRNLTPEAQRALAEAEERRQRQAQNETSKAPEVGGRNGPDPARYGDWEKGGIASDF